MFLKSLVNLFFMFQQKQIYFLTKTLKKSFGFQFKTLSCSPKMASKNVSLKKILDILEELAPLKTAEPWDNVGLLVEPFNYESVSKVLLTNDLSVPVMKEAADEKVNFIITYHPIIFRPLKNIRQSDWKSRIISECLAKGICIYSPHTAWDAAQFGLNDALLKTIGVELQDSRPIKPLSENPNLGAGKIGTLKNHISIKMAIENIKKNTGLTSVQLGLAIGADLDSKVKTVAVCAGSGASVLSGVKADLYITGEMSHHEVMDSQHNGSTCILLNHSNSERHFLTTVQKHLKMEMNGVDVVVSKIDSDPLISN